MSRGLTDPRVPWEHTVRTEGRSDAERDRMVDVIRSVAAALDASHTATQPEGLRPVPAHIPRQTGRSRNT